MENNKNIANICGKIRNIEKSYSYVDARKNVNIYYRMEVEVKRLSETIDYVPVVISERILAEGDHFPKVGEFIKLTGEVRSRNFTDEEGKHHSEVFFFATELIFCSDNDYDWTHNILQFDGFVCKPPNSYKTASGRVVTKFIVAINRKGRKNRSSYVPVVCFGNWAKHAKNLIVGDKISVNGRFQSRNYFRKQEVDNIQYTTHEISCISFESERIGTVELAGPKVVYLDEYKKQKAQKDLNKKAG